MFHMTDSSFMQLFDLDSWMVASESCGSAFAVDRGSAAKVLKL